jgi:hypothetical protein
MLQQRDQSVGQSVIDSIVIAALQACYHTLHHAIGRLR